MIKNKPIKLVTSLLATAYLIGAPAVASSVVSGDLITSSNLTTAWQECDSDSVATDVTTLDEAGCAFRTTPVSAGVTYSLTCGITVAKFASITLAFLDANDDTLATASTEVFDHVSGPYSVTLQAPADTVTGAIGIYGEPGSGFQDCVLLDATPVETATKGRITGKTWFDTNGDGVEDVEENYITGTPVTLLANGVEIEAQETLVVNGRYYFSNLDIDVCYTVSFGDADSTLENAVISGDNDAGPDGLTEEVCFSETKTKYTLDAGYVTAESVATEEAPGDYAICGAAVHDADASGGWSAGDSKIPNIRVRLYDGENNFIKTIESVSGRYVFSELVEGDYKIQFIKVDDYVAIESYGSIETGKSFIESNNRTPAFNIPADGNTDDGVTCTVSQVNGFFTKKEVALDPTVANDDVVTAEVGVGIRYSILENDEACDGVLEVNLIGHDVPGRAFFNSTSQKMVILDTTEAGTYAIEYGLRGVCGSYDTASLTVNLTEPEPVVLDTAPDAPICRVETGTSALWAGVDVFSDTETGFASGYNFYDEDKNLVITQTSDAYTWVILRDASAATAASNTQAYIDKWEMEWNAAEFGYDNTTIYYVSAMEDGVESALTECPRDLMSPIALDLENQGRIQQISGSFEVDLDNDGIKEALSRWFAPSAGILVNDNALGQVSGEDLYGNIPGVYADGFAELATLDVNADGQLTNDELVGLAIWTDLNSDTMVDSSELTSLADHSIVSLAVTHSKFMARAKLSNGKSMLMEDVWLPYAPMAQLAK